MQCIGLTGGIGSGKSLVTDMFSELHIPIIDADVIAREIVRPGTPTLSAIEHTFGPEYIDDKELNRKKLKSLIFSDPDAKQQLEAIMHPVIRQTILDRASKAIAPYCIIVVPLLAENRQQYTWLDKIIVVDVQPDVQQSRTIKRDNISQEMAAKIMASQALRENRLALADFIIDNNQSVADTQEQVVSIHKTLIGTDRS